MNYAISSKVLITKIPVLYMKPWTGLLYQAQTSGQNFTARMKIIIRTDTKPTQLCFQMELEWANNQKLNMKTSHHAISFHRKNTKSSNCHVAAFSLWTYSIRVHFFSVHLIKQYNQNEKNGGLMLKENVPLQLAFYNKISLYTQLYFPHLKIVL